MPFFRERKTGPQKLNDPPKAGRAHESQSWGSRHGCRNAEPEPAQHGEELGLPLADTPSGAGSAPCAGGRRWAAGTRTTQNRESARPQRQGPTRSLLKCFLSPGQTQDPGCLQMDACAAVWEG